MELDKKAVFRLLQDQNTYGTVLHFIAFTTFGEEIYEMDSIELYGKLKDIYGTFMHDDCESKLQAIFTIITTNAFFENIEVFKAICITLSEGDPGLSEIGMEDPTVAEMMWAMYEAELNMDQGVFYPVVSHYIDKLIENEVEEVDGEQIIPGYEQYMIESIQDMKRQFRELGVKAQFPPIEDPVTL